MSITLKGSRDGSVTLQAPADTSPTGTDKTFTLPTADGTAEQVLKTDGSGNLSFADNLASGRNLIINGDCRISQRGTTFAISTGTVAAYTVDRFRISKDSGGAFTVTQESDGPAGFNKSIKIATTTADTSLDSGEYNIFQYNIEGQDLQHLNYGTSDAKSTTLSFWVKSNMTGNLSVTSEVNAGPPYLAGSVAINSANTWEYKTITFIGNTATAIDDDNTTGIEFQFWLDGGSAYSSSGQNTTSWNSTSSTRVNSTNQINLMGSTSNYIQFTGLQYELGEKATPFEHRSIGDELARCQRYYEVHNAQVDTAQNGTGTSYGTWYFKQTKRNTNYSFNDASGAFTSTNAIGLNGVQVYRSAGAVRITTTAYVDGEL